VRLIKDIFQILLFALIIFLIMRFSLETRVVPSASMEPSLHPGQRVVINKLVYQRMDWLGNLIPRFEDNPYPFHPPKRGEIITFYPYPHSKDVYIKRVIAEPGEWVEIKGGKVYINDEPLYEPYIKDPPTYTFPKTLIPPNHYFVLGDNRNNSLDSHAIGPIPAERIIGKAYLIYWPPKYWGKAPNYTFKRS